MSNRPPGPDEFVVPINGWHLLIAWVVAQQVDTDLVRAVAADWGDREVEVEEVDGTGHIVRSTRPINEQDIADEWMMATDYLSDAGVPVPPEDTAVVMMLPTGAASVDELMERIDQQITSGKLDVSDPERAKLALESVLPNIYSRISL